MDRPVIEGELDPGLRAEIEKLAEELKHKGDLVAQEGRRFTMSGQYVMDLADTVLGLAPYFTPAVRATVVPGLGLLNRQTDHALSHLSAGSAISLGSVTGTAAVDLGRVLDSRSALLFVRCDEQEAAQPVIMQLSHLVQGAADMDVVLSLMARFGLDHAAPGRKSAVEQFRTAHDAYLSPVAEGNPVVTSLIPMREAIWLTVDALLKRRMEQESASGPKSKIVSIASQLKRAEIVAGVVEKWGEQWACLEHRLSDAKQGQMSRDDWRLLLQESTLFLKSFLDGLDEAKVNRKRRKADHSE